MKHWPLVATLVLLWLQLFRELETDWALNPQYAYGYMVPFLALGLAWRRWRDRPAEAGGQRSWLPLAATAAALLLPLRLIEEANPEWRLALWTHALLAVGITLCVAGCYGGTRWLKHFGFAIAFAAVAVPWPMFLEKGLIHGLMSVVASVVVEIAGFTGMAVVQHGNLIEVSKGLVGVDEACSGVRSLQTTLMMSLFFGELYRMNVARRAGLLGIGIGLAFLANIGRTYYLVWTAATQGFDALHKVHDGAGIFVMAVILPLLLLAAQALRKSLPAANEPRTAGSPKPVPIVACAAMALAVAGAELVTEGWYRTHESNGRDNARWSVQWPTNQYAFAEVPLSDTTKAMLRCDQGRSVSWTDSEANQWHMIFLRWEPGRNSAQLAKGHTPEICLPATGWKMVKDLGEAEMEVHGLPLPVRTYEFKYGSRTLFVFYCLWESRSYDSAVTFGTDATLESRWLAVKHGIRHRGQQVLELALEGPSTPQEATAILEQQLRQLVRLESEVFSGAQ